MMKEQPIQYENISEEQLSAIKSNASEFSELPGKCFYCHMTSEGMRHQSIFSNGPLQVNGFIFVLVVKGKISIEINTRRLEIEGPVVMVVDYGSTVLVAPTEASGQMDVHYLMYSPHFIQDINLSYSAFSGRAFLEHDDPMLRLQEREVNLVLRYLSLMNTVMKDNYDTQLSLHTLTSLTEALIYQIASLLYRRVRLNAAESGGQRRNSYVQDFLRLVHLNYLRERSVSYYADQLFISPKYLSLLVKEATGRSAARWIDFFVIMEAKNMLRYSGKNVQQVTYALNFSNQSAFGKYFKRITGMSPTEYQKS